MYKHTIIHIVCLFVLNFSFVGETNIADIAHDFISTSISLFQHLLQIYRKLDMEISEDRCLFTFMEELIKPLVL